MLAKINFVQDAQCLPHTQVYLVAGPTGSGKTVLAKKIATIANAVVLPMDNYFLDEEEVEPECSEKYGEAPQWDSPSACDFQLLISNVHQLVIEGKTLIPQFSFFENKRIGYQLLHKKDKQPIVVEGLYAIRCKDPFEDLDIPTFSIFVTADEEIRVARIKIRDLKERGRPEALFEKTFHFIRIAEQRWVFEQQPSADWIIDTSAGFASEFR